MTAPSTASMPTHAARVRDMIMGFRATRIVHAAACLDLATHLAEGACSASDLATRVGAEAGALRRLMRAMTGLGLLEQRGDDAFALTPLGEALRSDRGGSLRALAVLYGEPWMWQAYGGLLDGVRSGRTPFIEVHGQRFFDFLETRPDAAAVFDAAMSGYSAIEADAVAQACSLLATARHVVDVGGGRGVLLEALLRRHAHLRGTLFDRPPVVDAARPALQRGALASRIDCIAGDFFRRVEPSGADVYLLKSIVHDWEDDDAVAVLRSCRAAMASTSRLLIMERLLPEGGSAAGEEALLFDINMLVTAGGRERSLGEYDVLLRSAGLRLAGVRSTACALSILEAVGA